MDIQHSGETDERPATARRSSSTPAMRAPSALELRAIRVFAKLPAPTLERVRAVCTLKLAHTDEELPIARAAQNLVYFSISAHLRVTLASSTGRQCVLTRIRPGQHFGDFTSHAVSAACDATLLSESTGQIIEAPGAALLEIAQTDPALCRALLTAAAETTMAQSDRIFELCTLDLRSRLQNELLRLAAFADQDSENIVIRPAPTHEVLARIIGGTREGVTRELKALADAGLIQVKRKELTILHVEKLRALAAKRADFPGDTRAL